MMVFGTLAPLYEVGSPVYVEAACLLALLTGFISLLLGIFRFGFLIQLISHPVIKVLLLLQLCLLP